MGDGDSLLELDGADTVAAGAGADSVAAGGGADTAAGAGGGAGDPKWWEGEPVLVELPTRPDWLPEAFWKDGKLNLTAQAKALKDTQTALRNAKPAAPEAYELKLPEALAGVEVPPDDPLLVGVTGWGKKHGVSQAAFEELSGLYYGELLASLPDPKGEKAALEAAFGEETNNVLTATAAWARATFTDPAELAAVKSLSVSAAGVKLLNRMRGMARELPVTGDGGGDGGAGDGQESEAAIKTLMASDDYWTNPAKQKKVAAWYAKTYPST